VLPAHRLRRPGLVVTKEFTADLMLNVNSVEQQIRKYAEAPVIVWSDDCECRKNVSAVADLLRKFIITKDAKKSKPEARDSKNSKPDATSGRTTKVDNETQTEPDSRQRDLASAVKQRNVRRLEDENRKLSELVEDYKRKIVHLNDEMESILQDRTSHIQDIKMRYEEENHRQILKMRDMRDELLWFKKRLRGVRMPTVQ
jgi:predicted RNase H-like nuclease (RuvC/YqgF family)